MKTNLLSLGDYCEYTLGMNVLQLEKYCGKSTESLSETLKQLFCSK